MTLWGLWGWLGGFNWCAVGIHSWIEFGISLVGSIARGCSRCHRIEVFSPVSGGTLYYDANDELWEQWMDQLQSPSPNDQGLIK